MKHHEDSSRAPQRRLSASISKGIAVKDLPIGVFDSGVGGLTVLRQLQAHLPNESFVYFGDTANVPYGGRRPEELIRLTRQILDWMTQYPVKMAVMACNTSSALALEHVRHEYAFPILGIILPVAKSVPSLGSRIGVIATEGTVNSGCYAQAIREVDDSVSVFQMACPEFVPLIEQGKLEDSETRRIIQSRLQPLLDQRIDALIYGCTHYPHLHVQMQQVLPPSVQLVDPAVYITQAVSQELNLLRLNATQPGMQTEFYVSASAAHFAQQTLRLMNFKPEVQEIHWARLKSMPILS